MRTVRYLKPIQIYRRLWFRLYTPQISFEVGCPVSLQKCSLLQPAQRQKSMTASLTWKFCNREESISKIGWSGNEVSALWRYNQHYFDDLNAEHSEERTHWHVEYISRWISDNASTSKVGWDPYPTSLRIVNWLKWLYTKDFIIDDMLESLVVQTRWLEKRLEWHLLGNHLFTNAKALIFSGILIDCDYSARWLDIGFKILKREISEQILADGAHFELSPMYHALALEDLLDLINVIMPNKSKLSPEQRIQFDEWLILVPSIISWLKNMSHMDGEISFFNDAAFGVAPNNSELWKYAERLGFNVESTNNGAADLKSSGFVRLQHDDAVLIADFAEIGPTYLPGHAHADTLSLEMSLFGQRLFVNSGTSEYGHSKERLRQRGTSAHNTVNIDNLNSSEVWSSFRVGSRAHISNRYVSKHDETNFYAKATHDGYAKSLNGLKHSREIYFTPKFVTVKDYLSYEVLAQVVYHLHPSVQVEQHSPSDGAFVLQNGVKVDWRVSSADTVKLVRSTWHPKFGEIEPNYKLDIKFSTASTALRLSWG